MTLLVVTMQTKRRVDVQSAKLARIFWIGHDNWHAQSTHDDLTGSLETSVTKILSRDPCGTRVTKIPSWKEEQYREDMEASQGLPRLKRLKSH